MEENSCYENYPLRAVIVSKLSSLLTVILGSWIIYQFGIAWVVMYLIYVIFLEIRLYKSSCVNCYYYGKVCAFGKGKICSLLFKKGDPAAFVDTEISWRQLAPDMLVMLAPVMAGLLLLMNKFDWVTLGLIVTIAVVSLVGTGLTRSRLACLHCKQRELGCPAERLFNKPVDEL